MSSSQRPHVVVDVDDDLVGSEGLGFGGRRRWWRRRSGGGRRASFVVCSAAAMKAKHKVLVVEADEVEVELLVVAPPGAQFLRSRRCTPRARATAGAVHDEHLGVAAHAAQQRLRASAGCSRASSGSPRPPPIERDVHRRLRNRHWQDGGGGARRTQCQREAACFGLDVEVHFGTLPLLLLEFAVAPLARFSPFTPIQPQRYAGLNRSQRMQHAPCGTSRRHPNPPLLTRYPHDQHHAPLAAWGWTRSHPPPRPSLRGDAEGRAALAQRSRRPRRHDLAAVAPSPAPPSRRDAGSSPPPRRVRAVRRHHAARERSSSRPSSSAAKALPPGGGGGERGGGEGEW